MIIDIGLDFQLRRPLCGQYKYFGVTISLKYRTVQATVSYARQRQRCFVAPSDYYLLLLEIIAQ